MRRLSRIGKTLSVIIVSVFYSIVAFTQDSIRSMDIDIETTDFKGPYYAQLWFWVVLGLVFLFILIVLLRGNGGKKKDKVIEKDEEIELEKKDEIEIEKEGEIEIEKKEEFVTEKEAEADIETEANIEEEIDTEKKGDVEKDVN